MKYLYKANNGIAPGAIKGMLDVITDFEEWLEWLQLLEQDLQASCMAWVMQVGKSGNILHDSSVPNIESNFPFVIHHLPVHCTQTPHR